MRNFGSLSCNLYIGLLTPKIIYFYYHDESNWKIFNLILKTNTVQATCVHLVLENTQQCEVSARTWQVSSRFKTSITYHFAPSKAFSAKILVRSPRKNTYFYYRKILFLGSKYPKNILFHIDYLFCYSTAQHPHLPDWCLRCGIDHQHKPPPIIQLCLVFNFHQKPIINHKVGELCRG